MLTGTATTSPASGSDFWRRKRSPCGCCPSSSRSRSWPRSSATRSRTLHPPSSWFAVCTCPLAHRETSASARAGADTPGIRPMAGAVGCRLAMRSQRRRASLCRTDGRRTCRGVPGERGVQPTRSRGSSPWPARRSPVNSTIGARHLEAGERSARTCTEPPRDRFGSSFCSGVLDGPAGGVQRDRPVGFRLADRRMTVLETDAHAGCRSSDRHKEFA